MKIYLDFDGTVVEHQYPSIGKYNNGCVEVIQKLQDAGHEIILNTYRADKSIETLKDAVYFIESKSEEVYIDKIEKKKIDPQPWDWQYFMENDLIFIDDIAEGIPTKSAEAAEYDVVDWRQLDMEFMKNGVYA